MLALSDRRLWFTTHAMNFARPDFSLPLSELDAVDGTDGLLAGTLALRDRSGIKYALKLDFGTRWAEEVRGALASTG